MKKTISAIIALCIAANLSAAGFKTSFAIITDSKTAEKCSDGLNAYKDVLEKEGLRTFIVSGDWDSPEPIRELIKEKAADRKCPLEGVVLVGDVPVVMVRGAQHLTTAFKMDQDKYDIFESSVASDRFYDDFEMEFDFIKKDEEREGVFYYWLNENGCQHINPAIYSARMKVPASMPGDKYEILSRYLRKVVDAHLEQNNVLDHMVFFAGHGYNSDCPNIWRQRPMGFRESLPHCFKGASTAKFLNFRHDAVMKYKLFTQLQRPEVDYFQFSEHGAPDTQYINGDQKHYDLAALIERLEDGILRHYRYYAKHSTPEELEEFMHEAFDSLFLMKRSLVDRPDVESEEDSAEDPNKTNIVLDDLWKVKTNARVVVLNACYNGSFHNPEGYIAGAHVFGDGRCIVAQGNTVNVLQDKFEDKLVGYLSLGVRAGFWQKEIRFLESHMIGDPTFRFTPASRKDAAIAAELERNLVLNARKPEVWEKYMRSGNALLRAAGVSHLADCSRFDDTGVSAKILNLLRNEKSDMVKLHALNAIWQFGDSNTSEAVRICTRDNCENIVRLAARVAGASCDTTLISDMEYCIEHHPDFGRVCDMVASNALKILSAKEVATYVGSTTSVRNYRNDRYPVAVADLLSVLANTEYLHEVRLASAEALGWYNTAINREEIASKLETYSNGTEELPEDIRKEITKSLRRLRGL